MKIKTKTNCQELKKMKREDGIEGKRLWQELKKTQRQGGKDWKRRKLKMPGIEKKRKKWRQN